MRRYLIGLAGLAAIAGLLITAAAQAASKAGHPGTAYVRSSAAAPQGARMVRTLIGKPGTGKAGAKAASDCAVGLLVGFDSSKNPVYGPPAGTGICGTYEKSWWSGSGSSFRAESFVLGANSAIWHTWTGQSTWYSLGGQFCGLSPYSGKPCAVYGTGGYPNITVGGYGPDATQEWCATRQNNGGWSGWYKCG
jgi:hypothetical protein